MPALIAVPIYEVVKKNKKNNQKRKIKEEKEEFVIHKRTVTSGRIRNLRTGEPELIERDLPKGELFYEFFIQNFIVTADAFCAPFRESRLEEEEVNYIVAQTTTPKRKTDQQPMKRPRTSLSSQLHLLPTPPPSPKSDSLKE